jgi:hypothetical protein
VRACFKRISETGDTIPDFPLTDVLMSAWAMFGLKCGSLLKFDEQRKTEAFQNNLKNLYGVAASPCDTQMRTRLDTVRSTCVRHSKRSINLATAGGCAGLCVYRRL